MTENIEFTRENLDKVANLSRLSLTEEEKDKFSNEIKDILEFVGQIKDMTSQGINSSGSDGYGEQFKNSYNKNFVREDLIKNEGGHFTEALLQDAPARFGDFVEVSQVLDKHKK